MNPTPETLLTTLPETVDAASSELRAPLVAAIPPPPPPGALRESIARAVADQVVGLVREELAAERAARAPHGIPRGLIGAGEVLEVERVRDQADRAAGPFPLLSVLFGPGAVERLGDELLGLLKETARRMRLGIIEGRLLEATAGRRDLQDADFLAVPRVALALDQTTRDLVEHAVEAAAGRYAAEDEAEAADAPVPYVLTPAGRAYALTQAGRAAIAESAAMAVPSAIVDEHTQSLPLVADLHTEKTAPLEVCGASGPSGASCSKVPGAESHCDGYHKGRGHGGAMHQWPALGGGVA